MQKYNEWLKYVPWQFKLLQFTHWHRLLVCRS